LTLDGLPSAALARRWGIPSCLLAREVRSTLDEIHALGSAGAAEGSLVLAETQAAGRGRDGRTWQSPAGGIWLALLLRPRTAALGIVSIRAGLVLADVVDELVGAPLARLKWPNDVLLHDRKLAGVLCEGRWQGDALQWLGVGIGINVANPLPAALRESAIVLEEVLPGIRRLDVLDRLLPPFTRLGMAADRLTEREVVAFAARDWLKDRTLHGPVAGRGAGVRDDGALLVEQGGEVTAVREGHVTLAPLPLRV
jgi:BirA family transcriptional regulator, biotin operon repressor / biotin---[acetyl-CoA-carboxylase] ligase